MSETVAPGLEKVEAVIISGPQRGRIIELPSNGSDEISNADLALLNEALDKVISSLDRLIDEVGAATQRVESRLHQH